MLPKRDTNEIYSDNEHDAFSFWYLFRLNRSSRRSLCASTQFPCHWKDHWGALDADGGSLGITGVPLAVAGMDSADGRRVPGGSGGGGQCPITPSDCQGHLSDLQVAGSGILGTSHDPPDPQEIAQRRTKTFQRCDLIQITSNKKKTSAYVYIHIHIYICICKYIYQKI